MRIIGGDYRGRRLRAPPGRATRPTTERTREALFNILRHGGDVPAAPESMLVLDLFAGSGALGFEALSRGAGHVTFVENDRRAAALIAENAALLEAGDRVTVLRRDATRPGAAPRRFELVLLDPPYGLGFAETALQSLSTQGWLSPGARIVAELGAAESFVPPPGFEELTRRTYGAAQLLFLRAEDAS
jgi:16S rRNA (guanine966-N2)-methyltransferase